MALNLQKLFIDVFAPIPSDRVLFIIDVPHHTPDDDEWKARREMAQCWHAVMSDLAKERGFNLLPIAQYRDVALHNNSLPDTFLSEGNSVKADALVGSTSLVIAMTKWSASAPLHEWAHDYSGLRAASLPGITTAMETTALSADYAKVASYCRILQPRLDAAELAFIRFSTGDELNLDLRWRKAHMDDGVLHPDQAGKLINLPSGEVYSALYEGEHKGSESRTEGILPVVWNGSIMRLTVERNTVTEISAEKDNSLRKFLEQDAARRNIAELGLGCNPAAEVTGNILEDEKAGPHIALGRSDHLGGAVGPAQFQLEPWHQDFAYTRKCPIYIESLVLASDAAGSETLISRGHYSRHLDIPI